MTDLDDPKGTLVSYLQSLREALLWKLEGLGERDLRMPRTPTGTNLIGLVKHMANTEIWYFGDTFGRVWPTPEERITDEDATDPQADWYATADETCAGIVDLYRRVWRFADATIAELPLDAPGRVPWWGEGANPVTLQRVLVHVTVDLARHVGHADILREGIDGSAGLLAGASNLPERQDWPAYVARLTALATGSQPE
ncbi:MAG TPA: DinB family protein [Marmoricola sp.]|nr:DinB family protein [Marmoricola sp.]